MSKDTLREVPVKFFPLKPDLSKMLRTLTETESFHFCRATGRFKFIKVQPSGEKANSLADFVKKIRKIDPASLDFHYYRGDFERWLENSVGDLVLASRLSIRRRITLKGEALREFIINQLKKRYNEINVDFP